MKISFSVALFLVTSVALAHGPRSHGGHSHGAGELSLSFEGTAGTLQLRSPADSIYGFEHEAKTAAHKREVETAFAKIETEIPRMVKFDSSLKCVFSKKSVESVREKGNSKHSEVVAEFSLQCEKSPLGTEVKFDFAGVFPELKSVDVTVLADSLQKSLKVPLAGATLMLK